MEAREVIAIIENQLPGAEVQLEGEDCSFTAVVVSDSFSGERSVKRQQRVLAAFTEALRKGDLHSLSVKAYTPEEWQKAQQARLSVQIQA